MDAATFVGRCKCKDLGSFKVKTEDNNQKCSFLVSSGNKHGQRYFNQKNCLEIHKMTSLDLTKSDVNMKPKPERVSLSWYNNRKQWPNSELDPKACNSNFMLSINFLLVKSLSAAD